METALNKRKYATNGQGRTKLVGGGPAVRTGHSCSRSPFGSEDQRRMATSPQSLTKATRNCRFHICTTAHTRCQRGKARQRQLRGSAQGNRERGVAVQDSR